MSLNRCLAGSGTGTVAFDAPSGVYTEVQCGSFVFMDLDYSRNLTQQAGDQSVPTWSEAGVWEQSLFVYALRFHSPFLRPLIEEDPRSVLDGFSRTMLYW